MSKYILLLLLFVWMPRAQAQKQLLLLKNEDVLLRLYPGDDFIYRLKGSKRVYTTYVNNLSDTSVVTAHDTIPFHVIDRIYFRQRKLYNLIGSALVTFGAGLFLIDQLNITVVQGNRPSLDTWVSTVSLSSLAVGIPLLLLKKRSQKLKPRYRLMTVDRGSVFYRPDLRKNALPYTIDFEK